MLPALRSNFEMAISHGICTLENQFDRMLLKRGMGNGEWGMGNGMNPGNGKLKWEFEKKKIKKIYFFLIENKENKLKNEIENK